MNFEQIQFVILLQLHRHFVEDAADDEVSENMISSFYPKGLGKIVAKQAVHALGVRKFIVRDDYGAISITGEGINFVDRVTRESDPEFIGLVERFDRKAPFFTTADLENEIPASDRFVPINHNAEDLLGATQAINEIRKELEKNQNSLEIDSDQRQALIGEIVALADALKERVTRLAVVHAALGANGALNYLKNRFPDHALAALVGKALELLFSYFGKL